MDKAKQWKEMQDKMLKAKAALATQVVSGKAGHGGVLIEMNAAMEVTKVAISQEAKERYTAEALSQLVKDAMGDALRRAQKAASSQLSAMKDLMGNVSPFA
jgi:DNA-binding protein YbaB